MHVIYIFAAFYIRKTDCTRKYCDNAHELKNGLQYIDIVHSQTQKCMRSWRFLRYTAFQKYELSKTVKHRCLGYFVAIVLPLSSLQCIIHFREKKGFTVSLKNKT